MSSGDAGGPAWSRRRAARRSGHLCEPVGVACSPDPTEIGSQPDARFTREGTDTVGGQTCTIWDVQTQGVDAKICKTADGVLLRTDGTGMTITATTVKYGPQDPARFHVPAGYHKQDTP
jgi:hypothetical protein